MAKTATRRERRTASEAATGTDARPACGEPGRSACGEPGRSACGDRIATIVLTRGELAALQWFLWVHEFDIDVHRADLAPLRSGREKLRLALLEARQ